MKRWIGFLAAVTAWGVVFGLGPKRANAQSFVYVDFSHLHNARLQDQPTTYGIAMPASLTKATRGPLEFRFDKTGYNFWNSAAVAGAGRHVGDIPASVPSASKVHLVMATYWGSSNANIAYVEFFGSAGGYFKKPLVGNVDVRDYNQAGWTNSINGTSSVNLLAFTAFGAQQRLDLVSVPLPVDFLNQTLTSIRVVDDGSNGVQRLLLAGVAVELEDTTSPTSAFSVSPNPNAAGWHNTDVATTISANDNTGPTGIRETHYAIDMGAEQVVAGSTATFTIASEGVHTISYWAVDHAGNVEATQFATVKVDKTAPSVVAHVSGRRLTVDATDTGSGVAKIETRLDNGPYRTTTGPFELPANTRIVRARAVDAAGNVSPETAEIVGDCLKSVQITPSPAYAGSPVAVRVQLFFAAPAGGIEVALQSTHPSVLPLPATVVVPAGSSSVTRTIMLGPVPSDTMVGVDAMVADTSLTANVNVIVPTPRSLTASPSVVIGGADINLNLTLVSKAPAGGQVVLLESLDPAVLTVPASVTVPAGQLSVGFKATSVAPPTDRSVLVVAQGDGDVALCAVMVRRIAVASLEFTPSTVAGGKSATLKATLNRTAPSGGVTIPLTSSGAGATVPSVMIVPAGVSSATVTIATSSVAKEQATTVRAQLGGTSARATLTITPTRLASISVVSSSVKGGTSTTGTVTLTGSAPLGGLVVRLSSEDPALAAVPATVTVAAGASTATFPISTQPTASNKSVTLTAKQNLDTKTVNLNVTR